MSAADVSAEYPCPCENCDRFAMSRDEYCITCLHHSCRYGSPKCPGPLQVSHCGKCGAELREEILIDGLCGGCHHREDPGPFVSLRTPQARLAHFVKLVEPCEGGGSE